MMDLMTFHMILIRRIPQVYIFNLGRNTNIVQIRYFGRVL